MASLVLESPDGRKIFALGETTYIGRAPECDVVLADASISRRHARITTVQGRHVVQDEGSRYGTFVNGSQVTSSALSPGDRLSFGAVEVRYVEEEAAAPAPGAASLDAEIGERDASEVQRLRMELERTRTLLAMQHTFVRCTSLPMVLQGAGPEMTRAARADRGLILLYEERDNRFSIHYQQGLEQIPPHRVAEVDAAFGAAEMRPMAADEAGRVALALPIEGGGRLPQGIVYLEFPPGRVPDEAQVGLLRAMGKELGSALTHHRLLRKIREEAQARSNLSRYLSDQVVEAVLAGKIDLSMGGERRAVTVLFTDIRSFTTLSETMPPEQVLSLLNEYFSGAVPIIKKHEGTVDKFIGDALMAVFGAPNLLPDQALRAVRAAVEIRELVKELRIQWIDRPWAETMDVSSFAVGIGVNTGYAVAGNLGSEDRREYAVIGDAVNVASRLCSEAGADEILIGGDTAAAVESVMSLERLEPLQVKGRAQPVEAYRVA